MVLLIFYLLLAVIVSFSCSIMESVLLSTPNSFVWLKADKKEKWAMQMQDQKERIDRPLSAILSLNTVAHTIGAAGVGAQAAVVFGDESFAWVSAALTLIILVVTEIIPKTLGAKYWRILAPISTRTIRVTVFLTYPLVLGASVITQLLSGKTKEKTTSREELAALTEIAEQEGVVSEEERLMLLNVMRLQTKKVSEIMTPRTVVTTVNGQQSVGEICADIDKQPFSRLPVFEKNKDHVQGYVFRLDLYEAALKGLQETKAKDYTRPILTVSENLYAYQVWQKLLEKKEHLALVVNEYGGMQGLVTMEDILESIVGRDIVDERDIVTNMRAHAKKLWAQRQAMGQKSK